MKEGDCRDKDVFVVSKYEIELEWILIIKIVVIEDVFGFLDKFVWDSLLFIKIYFLLGWWCRF